MKRTAIITGGTKGLGREIALAFGKAGHCVLALYSTDDNAAHALQAEMANANIAGAALRHDVCSDQTAIWSRPEILGADRLTLINNACASFSPSPMHQLGWPDFEKSFQVAVGGAWSCSQALVRHMIKNKGGTMVNVLSSVTEGFPPKGFAAYVTAKQALRGFTLALAAEYTPRGIRVFSVSPSYMETPLTRSWDSRMREAISSMASRVTIPAEAAARVLELVENAAIPGSGENYPV